MFLFIRVVLSASGLVLCHRLPSSVDYRFENSLLSLGEILYQNFIYLPRLDTIMRKHFAKFNADKWPYFKEIIRARNGFTLVDTHHVITDPKPNNPNVLEMGGIHIKPTKPLPKVVLSSTST